ncbi:hypothetical protein ABE288_20515 [Bacillus salipaludis]
MIAQFKDRMWKTEYRRTKASYDIRDILGDDENGEDYKDDLLFE